MIWGKNHQPEKASQKNQLSILPPGDAAASLHPSHAWVPWVFFDNHRGPLAKYLEENHTCLKLPAFTNFLVEVKHNMDQNDEIVFWFMSWTWCVFLAFCVNCVFVSKGFLFFKASYLTTGRSGKQPEVWLYGKGCGWEDVHWKEKVLFVAVSPRSLGGTTVQWYVTGKIMFAVLRSTSCTRIFTRKTKGVEIQWHLHPLNFASQQLIIKKFQVNILGNP